ncbi:MAG: Mrp/NBP35 family ATP-binding protein [Halanaerobiales bacterium]|nr:Mrp/NBP35 family ATP-binding protein [Halanaerobiales bacterium]
MEKLALNDLSNVKNVIAVMSGKGGVGKSSVSALIAVELRRLGYKVGLLDADITGPSIPKMFGASDRPKQTDVGLFPIKTKTGIEIMSLNLLLENEDDPVIWRGPLLAQTVGQFWTDVVWGELDYLVLDLPPGTGDIPLTVMQSIPVDHIVLVSSPQDMVYMEVKKSLKMAKMLELPILGLIENMSYIKCPTCGEKIELFGPGKGASIEKELGIPFLAQLPIDPEFAKLNDTGKVEEYDKIKFDWLKEKLELTT